MPFIVAHPIVPFLRSRRAYTKKHGDRAPQKEDKRAPGDEGAHSLTTHYDFGETRVPAPALLTITTLSGRAVRR
jgi:hypothetical protein